MAEAKEPPLTPAQKQAVQEAKDANARKLEEKAPTTKTEMGKRFKKGGFVHNEGGIRMKRKYSEGDDAEPRRNPREIRQRQLSSVNLAKGGSVGSASKRADGCAQRGKTKGRVI